MGGKINWRKIKWGTLEEWLKKHQGEIEKRYHMKPFTKDGKMNEKLLRKMYKDTNFLKQVSGSHYKRIKRKIQFRLYVIGKMRR